MPFQASYQQPTLLLLLLAYGGLKAALPSRVRPRCPAYLHTVPLPLTPSQNPERQVPGEHQLWRALLTQKPSPPRLQGPHLRLVMSSQEQDTGLLKSEHCLRTSNTPGGDGGEGHRRWGHGALAQVSGQTAPRWPNASLEGWSANASIPHFVELHRLYKLKVWDNLASKASLLTPPRCSTCSLHVCVSYFGNSCSISNFSS